MNLDFTFKGSFLPERVNGLKSYYCWDGDIFLIGEPCNNDWQSVIYGFFDNNWELGVKRNGETEGRSSKFYQRIVNPMRSFILSGLIEKAKKQNKTNIECVLKAIKDGSPTIEEIREILESK